MSPSNDHNPAQDAMARLNDELLDEDSPLCLGLIDPTSVASPEDDGKPAPVSQVGAALMGIMFRLVNLDRVIRDRNAARGPLRFLVQSGGPTAPLARRELEQYDTQQAVGLNGGRAHVLPQLSPDAPDEDQRGQRELDGARYRAVSEAFQILEKTELDSDARWNAIRQLLVSAFPDEQIPSRRALRQTFLRRGDQALRRAEAIPSTIEQEVLEQTGQTLEDWDAESLEIQHEIFKRSIEEICSPTGSERYLSNTDIFSGSPEEESTNARERIGPLTGPLTWWRWVTGSDGDDLAFREKTAALVDMMHDSGAISSVADDVTRKRTDLAVKLAEIAQCHCLMGEILSSSWSEGPLWEELVEVHGTANTACQVLDSYEQWKLGFPWHSKPRWLLTLLSTGQEKRPVRPHIDALVERITVVLLANTLREHGVRRGSVWLWVHRLLAIAKKHPRAISLDLVSTAKLTSQYSAGIKHLQNMRVPAPPTHQARSTTR